MKGAVIAIFRDKGFCFIRGEDGLDRFGHVKHFENQIEFDRLMKNQIVEFFSVDLNNTGEIIRGNGLKATCIKVIQ